MLCGDGFLPNSTTRRTQPNGWNDSCRADLRPVAVGRLRMAYDIPKLHLQSLVVSCDWKGKRYTASEQREKEIRMKNEAVVQGTERASATAGVSGRSVNSSHITIAVIVALLGGIFLMLDSQFDRLHAQYNLLHSQYNLLHGEFDSLHGEFNELHGQFNELATKEDVHELNRRLVRIEEHLGIGTGSGSPRE